MRIQTLDANGEEIFNNTTIVASIIEADDNFGQNSEGISQNSNQELVELKINENKITLVGEYEKFEEWLSTNELQKDKPHKWFALKFILNDIENISYNGYLLEKSDFTNNSVILWLKIDELVNTPKEIIFSKDDIYENYIISFKEITQNKEEDEDNKDNEEIDNGDDYDPNDGFEDYGVTDEDKYCPDKHSLGYTPEEFKDNEQTYLKGVKGEWDFQDISYKLYPKFRLKAGDSFRYYGKKIIIKKFVNIVDDFGRDVMYIVYDNGYRIEIMPKLIFYAIYDSAIAETFAQTPYIKFKEKRIEISFKEGRIYPLEFETNGIIVDILVSNTFETASSLTNKSIEFYFKEDKLYFKALKPELNVITFKLMDKTYSKASSETLVIKVNKESELK